MNLGARALPLFSLILLSSNTVKHTAQMLSGLLENVPTNFDPGAVWTCYFQVSA